jgi:hypothetical protein
VKVSDPLLSNDASNIMLLLNSPSSLYDEHANFPPNVPTAARCHDIGRMLAEVINSSPSALRVAIVASGGLSHFVVDEGLDRQVIEAFISNDPTALRSIPRGALNSGSSEILNWIMTAGALQGIPLHWHEYQPLYRTPAGTGVGAAFCEWRKP